MKNYEKFYRWLLPVVGLLCVIIPEQVAHWIPTILGGIMVLTGITDTIISIKGKLYLDVYKKRASALILLIMGICFLLGQESTLYLMGITWGLLGLQEVNEEIEDIFIKRSRKEKWGMQAVLTGVKLVLSLALIFEPLEKFNFHIFLLGLEILAVTVEKKSVDELIEKYKDRSNHRGNY